MDAQLAINYEAHPTMERFHNSRGSVKGVMGPFGSGKSSGMCIEGGILRARGQHPAPDGVRRTRGAIIRNTYRDLESTTIKTWLEWFPEERFGKLRYGSPIEHILRYDDGDGLVEVQAWFFPLDQLKDVRSLKSLELSWVWINEASEVLEEAFEMLTGRVDRYPKQPSGVTYPGIFMDYNPPNPDHWIFRLAEEKRPPGYEFFRQPPAIIEDPSGSIISAEGNAYRINPEAENIQWVAGGGGLEKGARYYTNFLNGKGDDFIKVFGKGEYGYVKEGRPVYTSYNDNVHYDERIIAYPGLPLTLCFDFGQHTACVFLQMTPAGQIRVIDEVYAPDKSLVEFIPELLQPHLAQFYPGYKIGVGWGDPAGNQPTGLTSRTCFQELKSHGLDIRPAPLPKNDFLTRKQAVDRLLSRMVGGGKPAFIVGPKARMVRSGFLGQYRYARRATHQGPTYQARPEKNDASHPHDALQYGALGILGPLVGMPLNPAILQSQKYMPLDSVVGY